MKGKTKQNPYRFSVSLDETDAEHRAAAAYLNSIGRKKSRVIVRALMAYLGREALPEEHDVRPEAYETEKRKEKGDGYQEHQRNEEETEVFTDGSGTDQAEIDLMRRHFGKENRL